MFYHSGRYFAKLYPPLLIGLANKSGGLFKKAKKGGSYINGVNGGKSTLVFAVPKIGPIMTPLKTSLNRSLWLPD